MVLGKLPEPGRPTIWITVGFVRGWSKVPVPGRPTDLDKSRALAVGASRGCLYILLSILPLLFLPLRGGRVVRWCWVNFQCRGVLQFGLQ